MTSEKPKKECTDCKSIFPMNQERCSYCNYRWTDEENDLFELKQKGSFNSIIRIDIFAAAAGHFSSILAVFAHEEKKAKQEGERKIKKSARYFMLDIITL
jgi:hypothetical protein